MHQNSLLEKAWNTVYSCLKFLEPGFIGVWNKIILPTLYYGIWTPLKFTIEKLSLFTAFVAQAIIYPVVLIGATLGISICLV